STMLTCTLTLSPARKSGMSERSEAASTASRMCMVVRSLQPPPVDHDLITSEEKEGAERLLVPLWQNRAQAQTLILPQARVCRQLRPLSSRLNGPNASPLLARRIDADDRSGPWRIRGRPPILRGGRDAVVPSRQG